MNSALGRTVGQRTRRSSALERTVGQRTRGSSAVRTLETMATIVRTLALCTAPWQELGGPYRRHQST